MAGRSHQPLHRAPSRRSRRVAMAVPRWGGLCQQPGEKCRSAPRREMPRYLGDASGKMRRGNGMEGAGGGADTQQKNCWAGGSRSCGWWEQWGKALLVHGMPRPAQSCPGQHGVVAAGAGTGLVGLQPSDGWTRIKPVEPHRARRLRTLEEGEATWDGGRGVPFGLRICGKRLENIL